MPAMKSETRLSRYQRAIDELLRSGSRSKAADHAGVSIGTIDRWHKDGHFLAMLAEARTEATRGITTLLWNALDDATATLVRNLVCGQPASEIRAARTLFEITLKLYEVMDLHERLSRLEASQQGDPW